MLYLIKIMLYAVVDIETTGGYAAAHGITEIAIKIHDGETVIDSYETLINPHQHIPIHIHHMPISQVVEMSIVISAEPMFVTQLQTQQSK